MITVRANVNKADILEFLTKGYGLKAFDVFTYVSATIVSYKGKILQFNLNSDMGSVTYYYSKRTWLGNYELRITYYVSGTMDSPKVSVEVKGKDKPGLPKAKEVENSFNEAKFADSLSLYEKLYGRSSIRQELVPRNKVLSMIRSLSSKGGKYKLTVTDYTKSIKVVIDEGKVSEFGGKIEDLQGDILVVEMGETTRELAI